MEFLWNLRFDVSAPPLTPFIYVVMPISSDWSGTVAGYAILGGSLLGITASTNLFVTGRITGISGILGRLLQAAPDWKWRASFVAGLFISGVIAQAISYDFVFGQVKLFETSLLGILIAGFLVGFGTQLGNGCTSGHGLCGLPRLSIRSVVNTGAFFGVGVLVASLTRLPLPVSLFGQDGSLPPYPNPADSSAMFVVGSSSWYATTLSWWPWLILAVAVALFLAALVTATDYSPEAQPLQAKEAGSASDSVEVAIQPAPPVTILNTKHDVALALFFGMLFGTGLCFSGMADLHRVSEFLDLNPEHGWDPQLMLVLGAGVTLNFIAFRFVLAQPAPLMAEKFGVPTDTTITARLVLGGCIFGCGWGMCGICPGPLLVGLACGRVIFPIFTAAMLVGIYAFVLADKYLPF